jgi:hypothetical protein
LQARMVPGVIDRSHGILVVLTHLQGTANIHPARRCKTAADAMIDANPPEYNKDASLARTGTAVNSVLT